MHEKGSTRKEMDLLRQINTPRKCVAGAFSYRNPDIYDDLIAFAGVVLSL